MQELIKIGSQEISIKEFQGKRVVTFKDVDVVHERPEGTARRNFNTNKKYLIEGEDYFVRNSYEAKDEFGATAPNGLVLLTEQGYLMLVKSFTDDLAWQVQRELVNTYFTVQKIRNPFENLSKELQAIFLMDGKVQEVEKRVEVLEDTMTIDYGRQQEIGNLVNKVVINILGGKESNAYKTLGKKVFSECNRDIKNYFNVNARGNIARKDFERALNYVKNWKPCTNTLLNIQDCNAQMSF